MTAHGQGARKEALPTTIAEPEKGHEMNEAEYPYAGSSGWSGTETSKARADRDDSNGTTAARQAEVLARVKTRGWQGLTVAELRNHTGLHHGAASGVLSVLHKTGQIERLTEVRDRCKVYVHPLYVAERQTEAHGRADTVTISRQEYNALVERAESFDNKKWEW